MRDRNGEYGERAQQPAIGAQRDARFERGQVVMGPAFYVWDDDPRQAREWGVELAKAWLARHP
jgi:hypothetical protein